ncbi:unnamed protein product [Ranitomeya imitator]|uniref:ribonuclease H n=1 Tax=Ranitomeya imitator TaxID=111125 RepID=A0ABN9MCA3_9NEOB|nr:unnamed protein product [Ranitomeya imitator]
MGNVRDPNPNENAALPRSISRHPAEPLSLRSLPGDVVRLLDGSSLSPRVKMAGGTLYTYPDNWRAYKPSSLLSIRGFPSPLLPLPQNSSSVSLIKTPEFLKKFPLGKVPAFEGNDGFCLFESSAIAHYVGNDDLRGASRIDQAQVLQWVSFADNHIVPPASAWVFPTLGIMQFNKQTLYTYPDNWRAYKPLIAAQYSGFPITVASSAPEFQFGVTNKTPEFLKKFPLGKVPAFEGNDGFCLFESSAIAHYGKTAWVMMISVRASRIDQAQVLQWVSFADNHIVPPASAWVFPTLGIMQFNKQATEQAKEEVKLILATLDAHLRTRTFLVGERITLADVAVTCSLLWLYKQVLDPSFRQPFGNVTRWFITCVNQPQFHAVLGEVKLCDKMAQFDGEGFSCFFFLFFIIPIEGFFRRDTGTKILAQERAQKSGPGSVPHPLAYQSLSVGGDEDVHHQLHGRLIPLRISTSGKFSTEDKWDIFQDRVLQRDHFQFVALPFGLATAPRVFTKIMAALMAILRVRGLVLFPYLDDILIKAPSFAQAHESLSIVLDTLARFGWLVNRKKSCLIPSQRIIFLGMLFDTRQSRVFLPTDKRSTLCRDIRLLQGPRPPSLRSAMKVLGRMVATLEAIPFAQFHSRPLQQAILSQWDRSVFSLDRPIKLSFRVRRSLNWWLTSPLISQGRSFLPVHWQVVTTDASLLGWGAVFRHLTVQGRWSLQESSLPINVLEIRAIFLSLRHWERILRGLPVRIQTDNATAVAYVNHQGGTRSSLALAEVSKILLWAEATVLVISAVHIPGVENWAADFLSREGLAAGEWSLHPEVFHQICLRWGTPDVDLTASRVNRKVPQFVSRSRDPLAVGVDALAIPWSQFELPYLFPPLPLLPKLLKKIKAEGVPVILIAPDWPRRAWFAELVNLLADAPWRLPDRPDLLSQGPICHPNSRTVFTIKCLHVVCVYFTAKKFAELQPKKETPKKEKPAKEQKKEKEEKKPAPPPASAAEEDLDESEKALAAEPKSKDPYAHLPKSSFIMDEFKRKYSNEDTLSVALPYFWEHFDKEGWSIWYSEYSFPSELTQSFMSCNLITGMFQRLDKLRKTGFASVILFGTNNDSSISGVWVFRGQDLAFTLSEDWQIDYESYNWRKLDPDSEECKTLVKEYFCWEGEFKHVGKPFNQGKIFK